MPARMASSRAPRPLLLFAPGAGAPSTSSWMRGWAARLSSLGDVIAFDYPYMREGRKAPDKLPVLIQAHAEALALTRKRRKGKVVLVGKSMGSRVGCHVSLEASVDALVCLGYPLKGQSGKIRDEILRSLSTPVLFVQGSRDPLCPLELLEKVRRSIPAPNALHVVQAGNHSLEVTKAALKSAGEAQGDVDARILAAIRDFLASHGVLARRARSARASLKG